MLTGCATTQPLHPDHTACDQVGNYARSIETLEQIGVKLSDVAAYTAQPAVATFPLQRVRTLVYLKTFDTPAAAHQYFYDMCVQVGYTNLFAALDTVARQDLQPVTPKLDQVLKPRAKKKGKKK